MADAGAALDVALGLIRGDLDRIQAAVTKGQRLLGEDESKAVVRYAGALVEAQRAEIAIAREAEKQAAALTPRELLAQLSTLPGVRDALASGEQATVPARGKGRRAE